jgi:hypothetical protein
MKFDSIQKYFFNCFLLTIPILLWNFVLADKLPEAFQPEVFWSKIPPFIAYGENISRTIMFAGMLLMPLKILTKTQQKGVFLYVLGTLIYFASWLILVFFPNGL